MRRLNWHGAFPRAARCPTCETPAGIEEERLVEHHRSTAARAPVHGATTDRQREARQDPVIEQAQTRLKRLHAGLEGIRKVRGLWVADDDGEPQWLAPDGRMPARQEPVELT